MNNKTINFGKNWRTKLGNEFRKTALINIAHYVEDMGDVKINNDDNTYKAILDISRVKNTIFPLDVSYSMTTRETCFIAMIKSTGHIESDNKLIPEKVTLYDIQGKVVKNSDVCIDSMLYLLDFLESK